MHIDAVTERPGRVERTRDPPRVRASREAQRTASHDSGIVSLVHHLYVAGRVAADAPEVPPGHRSLALALVTSRMSSAGPRARRGEDSDLMHSLRDRSVRGSGPLCVRPSGVGVAAGFLIIRLQSCPVMRS